MKKFLAIIFSALLICSASACSQGETEASSETTAEISATTVAETTQKSAETDPNLKEKLDGKLTEEEFEGVAQITKDGEVIYQFANGTDELGEPITIESNMYIGSVSKQFCAAAIMALRDQGKLSVDDSLSKYFPEYKYADKLTIKNLLTMRSGIYDMVNEGMVNELSLDNTAEENAAAVEEWIFGQELKFEPDSSYAYSNSNFFLLGEIVEQVSGKTYIEFMRETFFEPLGMNHTGCTDEVFDSPDWVKGLKSDSQTLQVTPKGLPKGAGDIVSTAADMDAWMSGIRSGKIISKESFEEMAQDYSPDFAVEYGYGLERTYNHGIGHNGLIGNYNSVDYISEDGVYQLYATANNNFMVINTLPSLLLGDIME